jgi:hypothetical protein
MRKTFYLLLLSVILCSGLFAQSNSSIKESYESYFKLPRESIFLHLNKSTYVVGEELWFSAYAYDRKNNVPFTQTTNLHVALYNQEGIPIVDQLVMMVNGHAKGNISIDSTYASGDYFIRASTNWMRNFTEDDSFLQKIQVINENAKVRQLGESNYDLQLLPEGGHLVEGLESVIGVKLIGSDGRGVVFNKGSLVNDQGKIIMDFKGNAFGMASFPFRPESEIYSVSIKLGDNRVVKAPLPAVSEKGFVLRVVNNYGDNELLIAMATNKKTLNDIRNKKFRLFVHKDGDIATTRSVAFDNLQRETLLTINRKLLFPGVNTATLFDEENKPIAERLFFNPVELKDMQPEVYLSEKIKDSLAIGINVSPKFANNGSLSISVLPAATRAYNQKVNILSEFLLKPYVSGYIENPAYYFRGFGPRRNFDLDLLLLTQGWSRYEWRNIFNHTPNVNFNYENGLTLKGRFNNIDIEKYPQFVMEDSRYHNSRVVELEGPDFGIPNLLVEKGEKIGIKLVKENGELKSTGLYARILTSSWSGNLSNSQLINTSDIKAPELPKEDYKLENKTIILEEVNLVGEKRKFSNIIGQEEIVVDQQVVNMFPRVTDLIRMKGYNIIEGLGAVGIRNRRTLGGAPPVIYLDGTRILAEGPSPSSSSSQSQSSGFGAANKTPGTPVTSTFQNSGGFSFLYELYTAEIERIEINPRPDVTEGVNGAGGVIRIWTRRTPLKGNSTNADQRSYIDTTNGFVVAKKFYTPKYIYANPLFELTGAIHWEPQLAVDSRGKAIFNIADTGIQNISFYIEGMSEDGSLISTIKTINLSEKSNP